MHSYVCLFNIFRNGSWKLLSWSYLKKKTPKNPQILLHNESSKLETYSPSPVNIEVTLSDMKLKGIAITE